MTDEAPPVRPPPGVRLAGIDEIAEGAARNFVLQMRDGRFHGFVVRRGGAVFGYRDRCPHMRLPLAQTLDRYLTDDGALIQCRWHGALFDIENGACVAGPCMGGRLERWPVCVSGGAIVTD